MTEAKVKKEVKITEVAMTDGRTVEFTGERTLIKHDVTTADGMPAVCFDFVNGETRTVTIDIGGLSAKLAQHGLKQKIGDEVAGVKDLDDALEAVDNLIARLSKGDFNTVRQADALAGAGILVRAIVEVTGNAPEAVRTWLAGKNAAEKKAMRNSAKVAAVIARIEAEKAAKAKTPAVSVDVDALFGELGAA